MADENKDSSEKKSDEPLADDKDIKKTISSGYTNDEINKIVANAKNIHVAKDNLLAKQGQQTRNRVLNAPFGYATDEEKESACRNLATKENLQYSYFEVNGQPLRIQLGFQVERDVKVAETRMHSGFDNTSYQAVKHLYFQGDAGISFDVTVMVRNYDEYIGKKVNTDYIEYTKNGRNKTVIAILNDWCRTFTVCEITSLSELIENGYYRITKFHPKQVYNNYVQIEMTFVQDTYSYAQPLQSKQTMSVIENVDISQGGVIKDENTGGGQLVLTGMVKKLHDCGKIEKTCKCTTYRMNKCNTKYSECVLALQHCLQKATLYIDGKLDGLFCYYTMQAIKEFQKRHSKDKTKPLTITGKLDKDTKEKLIEEVKAK